MSFLFDRIRWFYSFTEGAARKYDGEIIRSAVDGLKFVNFNLAGGLKADSKAFENVSDKMYNDQNAFIGYRLSRFAVASNEISTQYGVSVYISQSSASVNGNGTSWVKVGKEYSIFGKNDNKAAGQMITIASCMVMLSATNLIWIKIIKTLIM